MRRSRSVALSTTNLDAPSRRLTLDATAAPPQRPSPNPSPRPRAADRIREAFQRWLEEDM